MPTPTISVHKNYKIQAALCIERPPTRVLEPDFRRRWREFKTSWEKRTGNSISLSDELVFMRFFFQWLGDTTKERQISSGGSLQLITSGRGAGGGGKASRRAGWGDAESGGALARAGGAQAEPGGLDSLLATQGLDLAFPEHGRKVQRRRRVEHKAAVAIDDSNIKDVRRLASNSLFLVVRYAAGARWTIPKADRVHGEGMRETLLKMCERQLGPELSPHVIGACPFSHRKRRCERGPDVGVHGRKIFYYRARVPLTGAAISPADGLVSDYAWCSRGELSLYLSENEWHAVRDGLPLDDVTQRG